MIGVPVIINHKDITTDNVKDERVGVVSNVWFNDKDGWYWCDGVIWDETAQNLITEQGWSVSCSYDVLLADDAGGTENNIPYDIEFLDGVFTHLAIVDNPRYERANIVFNSKTIINSQFREEDHPRDEAGKFTEKGKAARKTQANYGRKVRLKEGDKTGIIIGSVPHGDDPDTGEEMFLYEIKWDNGGIERIHSNKVDLTIDLKELEKEIDDNLQSWMTPRNLERIKKQKSSQESKGWTREEMEDYYRSSIAGDDFAKKWEYAKAHPWKDLTKAQNNKEQDMALLDELKKLITKIENDKGEDMDDKDKVENEKVDKRKLIDEVAGIMKSAGADDEQIRTAIGKMEKLGYDKSEAGTADNEKEDESKDDKADNKKVKNEETEEDKKEYKELKDDVKKDVENKCKNSVENSKPNYFEHMNKIYNSAMEAPKELKTYVSQAERLEAGNKY